MTRFLLLPLGLLAAIACSGGTPPPTGLPGRVVRSLDEIAGPWDIASFAGYAPTRLHGGVRRAYVDVERDSLRYVIECNYSGTAARIDETGTLHRVGDEPLIQTAAGCGPEREARDAAFFGFLLSRPKVAWIDDGRLRLSNGRTELVLERPERRRLANVPAIRELAGRWLPQSATRILDRNGHEGRSFQQPHAVTIGNGTISYPGCGGQSFAFRYEGGGRMTITSHRASEDCGFDEPSTVLVRVLRGGPLVERDATGGIALTTGDEVISLRPEEVRREGQTMAPPPE